MPVGDVPDSLKVHEISTVTVSASIKHNGIFSDQPLSVSSLTDGQLRSDRVRETKSLSMAIPNFIQADYGSKMTSSIYIRGIGARMEQPAVGLYVDNIPIMNKNNYDLDYYDIRRIYVLRGPQGTLYGRNTIGGVIDIHTLSPFDHEGTAFSAGYGNGNTSEAAFSAYIRPSERFGFSAAFNHMSSDGFFTNEYDGAPADRILSEGARLKAAFKLGRRWTMENTLMGGYVRQSGFAYSFYDEATGTASPVNHNDPCSYERLNVIVGSTLRYGGPRFRFSSTTSYQFFDDDMTLDQDFTPESMFTINQTQREHAVTQEFVLRPSDQNAPWQWITGAFGFYKHNDMEAPVTFKRDGIDRLILANANAAISEHVPIPGIELLIEEDSFPINSLFELPVWGASLYHQSSYRTGRWRFAAGIRADFERASIKYDNNTAINYRLKPTMTDYKKLEVELKGHRSKSWLEFMPHLSATYSVGAGTLYASVARGYKSGGYNTQIFSDILQNKMMTAMMEDLGIYPDIGAPYDVDEAISYKPEYSWNYEAGTHLSWFDGRLNVDAAIFFIDLRDQQLTVFPPGETTGRMMSNAGRSRSLGAELSAAYFTGRFRLTGAYGYTDTRFIDFVSYDNDGAEVDCAGKFVPYVPQNTVSVSGAYMLPVGARDNNIVFQLAWQGMGRLYWNETNTASQDFYGMLNASATFNAGRFSFGLWGRNLTDTRYNTFYFRSVGNSFVQKGKPLQFGASLHVKL